MTYVGQTLAPGENILFRAQFNWTYSLSAFLWCLFGFLPLLYASFIHATTGALPGSPAWIYSLTAAPAFLATWLVVAHMIDLWTTEIVVTSGRFVFKKGLIARKTKEVSLNKIEEINLQQSIFGRLFGYGHMTLRGTGVGVIQLPDVDNPMTLRRCIEQAKVILRQQAPSGPGSSKQKE
ncbi:MAG: PH domain-containing protein [Pseudomonadota bacterium]